MYWLNENNEEIPNLNRINEFNKTSKKHKIIIGPTEKEHEFLINNFSFYKEYFYKNRIAFCSDLYRFWKASELKEPICYADVTIEFDNNKLEIFLDYLEKENLNFFILESPIILWSGFWVCFNLQDTFKKILEKYRKNKNVCSSPIEMTKEIRKIIKYKPWKKQKYENNNTLIEDINFLKINNLNNSFIRINPRASWKKNKINAIKLWENKILNFNKKKLLFRDSVFLKLPRSIQVKLISSKK